MPTRKFLESILRFVDLSTPEDLHIQECFVSFLCLPNIRGQAYDGTSVMSSGISGVQAKIKEKSPLALYTHCYCHCLSLSIDASCKVQEVRNVIGVINECFLFLEHSPKRQRMFELTVCTCRNQLTLNFRDSVRRVGQSVIRASTSF